MFETLRNTIFLLIVFLLVLIDVYHTKCMYNINLLLNRQNCKFDPLAYLEFRIWSTNNLIHQFDFPIL